MIVAMHQPSFLPWLGFFYKMAKADLFVYLDTLAYSKGSYIPRVRIKTHNGPRWLTVPVLHTGTVGGRILDARCGGRPDWRKRLVDGLKGSYLKSPHYRPYGERIAEIILASGESLAEMNIQLITYIAGELGIRTPVKRARDMNIQPQADATDRLIAVCKIVGADVYLSGFGGAKYQDEARYAQNGIKLVYSDFRHPTYLQGHGEFVPGLSVVDLLFNCGQNSPAILGL